MLSDQTRDYLGPASKIDDYQERLRSARDRGVRSFLHAKDTNGLFALVRNFRILQWQRFRNDQAAHSMSFWVIDHVPSADMTIKAKVAVEIFQYHWVPHPVEA